MVCNMQAVNLGIAELPSQLQADVEEARERRGEPPGGLHRGEEERGEEQLGAVRLGLGQDGDGGQGAGVRGQEPHRGRRLHVQARR